MAEPVVHQWLIEPLDKVARKALERVRRTEDVCHIAIMPDVHPAAGINNGVVIGTRRLIYPAAVGGDIGCGYAWAAFDGEADALRSAPVATCLLDRLRRAVPVMRHRRRDGPPHLQGELRPEHLSDASLRAVAAGEGRLEWGTLGRGNHFLEFQADADDRLWVMVHSGSRAMGQAITAHHLARATSAGGGLAWLDAATDVGQAYLNDLAWARAYAASSRLRMLEAARSIVRELTDLELDESTLMSTDHNRVDQEEHGGEWLWVHRKGANEARAGQANVVPGSMGTATVHVEGRGVAEALASSSHGAGRRWSRYEARSKIRRRDVERQLAHVAVDARVVGRLTDEAPDAYKDLDRVMRAQRDLVRVRRRLTPVLCYKGA